MARPKKPTKEDLLRADLDQANKRVDYWKKEFKSMAWFTVFALGLLLVVFIAAAVQDAWYELWDQEYVALQVCAALGFEVQSFEVENGHFEELICKGHVNGHLVGVIE